MNNWLKFTTHTKTIVSNITFFVKPTDIRSFGSFTQDNIVWNFLVIDDNLVPQFDENYDFKDGFWKRIHVNEDVSEELRKFALKEKLS